MSSEEQGGNGRVLDVGMSGSIWSAPASAPARVPPAPIDTTVRYNAYLSATPTSADSNTTRLIPANPVYTPLSDTNRFTEDEMRLLDKASDEAAARAKFREVAERNMSPAAARVAYPHLYIDAGVPTKLWPWGGVAGSEAVKQLETKILASLAESSGAATATYASATGASTARTAATTADTNTRSDESTPMDITPATATRTAPRTSAYPYQQQPENVQRGPVEPKKADIVWVSKLAKDVEEALRSFPGVNNTADVATVLHQVSALLYRDFQKMRGSSTATVTANEVAEKVHSILEGAFANRGQQFIERTLDMEALAAILRERAAEIEGKGKTEQPTQHKTSAESPPTPNLDGINTLMDALVDIFPTMVANIGEMVSGLREVATMLERDLYHFGSAEQYLANAPVPTPAAEQVHTILLSSFTEQAVSDAQKICDIRTTANILREKADAFSHF